MKIPKREINIFNMSMLDVICGALGAFLIVTVVLFPSYQNRASVIVEEVGKAKEQNERLRREIGQARRAATVPPRTQQMMRENRTLEQELASLEESQPSKPPSPGNTRNPPLLVWIAWTRPQLTKHFSVFLRLVPSSPKQSETEADEDIKRRFKRGFYGELNGPQIVRYTAPREQPNTVFNEGLTYNMVGDPKPTRWYVIYHVSERTELMSRGPAPEIVTVYGFAVYGKQEVRLPDVKLKRRGSSALVGVLLLDRAKGLRFEEIVERK